MIKEIHFKHSILNLNTNHDDGNSCNLTHYNYYYYYHIQSSVVCFFAGAQIDIDTYQFLLAPDCGIVAQRAPCSILKFKYAKYIFQHFAWFYSLHSFILRQKQNISVLTHSTYWKPTSFIWCHTMMRRKSIRDSDTWICYSSFRCLYFPVAIFLFLKRNTRSKKNCNTRRKIHILCYMP